MECIESTMYNFSSSSLNFALAIMWNFFPHPYISFSFHDMEVVIWYFFNVKWKDSRIQNIDAKTRLSIMEILQ